MGLTGSGVLQLGLAGHAARSAPPRCPGLVRFPVLRAARRTSACVRTPAAHQRHVDFNYVNVKDNVEK